MGLKTLKGKLIFIDTKPYYDTRRMAKAAF